MNNPYARAVVSEPIDETQCSSVGDHRYPNFAKKKQEDHKPSWISTVVRSPRISAIKHLRLSGIPLRSGLMAIVLVVSAIGLIGSSFAVNRTMQQLSYSRIDMELESGLNGWAAQDSLFETQLNGALVRPPTEFYVVKIYPNGTTSIYNEGKTSPDLGRVVIGKGAQTVDSSEESAANVEWRVIAERRAGVTIVVAKDITQEVNVLKRLALGQVIIVLAVLLLMALLAYVLIQRALRPLREVEMTAKAIAAGDLDRRVPNTTANTEVGALSSALNSMISQLQGSIVELRDKEAQMRRFVGDASHELRTPLTSVKGYAELYRSGATTDADLVIEKIEDEAKRMSLLVEDLLALTRAEGARHDSKPVDLLDLALNVSSSLRGAYPDRDIDVRSECADVPVVEGDAARLHQVLTNLVANALKHGGDSARVTIKLADAGSNFSVKVIDDGIGLSEEDASHIFERFYRADSSRARSTGGSGLGLAIVKSLVESHGGEVSVESEQGHGTTFIVELPKTAPKETKNRNNR
ncbi:sensor histidine kinase [Corynebacterium diphtheriae]|uniref:sensor histidine kinase n=2 Tax=Corynebacterium diphtheriae TaxID=1717 RepID=UPI00092B62D1|nr:HAMP domain-containing sensor histidine kinase [Corynebacterium diphtheriae]OJI01169.1 two-component sensor histidine kinase [Corynebacterium diphtheriae]OSQ07991.1 two-component sensor histidine kinase [Corynebacterium diphtheriae]OSQ22779.1 two-component sensor histidine kinase [Corynebacterium diphtheriae]PSA78477.1 two-component sensor histidine kinase [Corynebacterium diphtheriae]CAB0614540.1 HAMP domain-containing histidine kinase [Corynebacterium diphtheriae]